MKHKLKRLFSLFLLALFLFHNVNQIFFIHTHSEDGSIVVHAHPSKEKEHTHTTCEYTAIAHFNHQPLIKTDATFFICEVACPYLYSVENFSTLSLFTELHLKLPCRRGPPQV